MTNIHNANRDLRTDVIDFCNKVGYRFIEADLKNEGIAFFVFESDEKVVFNRNFKQQNKEPIKKAACVDKRKTAIPQREFSSK